jgi:hypothetical protein
MEKCRSGSDIEPNNYSAAGKL